MSLIDKIEKIQKKPELYRKKILFVSLFFCMVFIIGIYIITLKYSFSFQKENKSVAAPIEVLSGDFSKAKESIGSGFGEVKDFFSNINSYGQREQ